MYIICHTVAMVDAKSLDHTPALPARPAPRPRSAWDAWGTKSAALPTGARPVLSMLLKGTAHPVARVPLDRVRLSASTATAEDIAALRDAVGGDAADSRVSADDAVRLLHLGGKSTPDLLARRSFDVQSAPDLVVSASDHDDVARVIAVCRERSLAIVPFGGGTSVVGGVQPERGEHRAVIALDLAPTAALLELDDVSLLARFGAGTTGPQAEELLAEYGFTLGHFPQSFEYASLGGYAATRSSGQASRGFGRFDDLVHGMRVATPVGDIDLGRAPASAAGPDLRQVFLGSEGAFGVITEVVVRIRPLAAVRGYGAWSFPTFESGATALRVVTQAGLRPTVLRLSDESETRVNAALGAHLRTMRGALAIATFEGASQQEVDAVATATDAIFRAHGAKARGEDRARSWERGRFHSPALRDTLLDAGVLAETLETATTWSALPELYARVSAALTAALTAEGTPPVIMCHISHVYPAGASLYFTVVAALTEQPASQWAAAKRAASDAIAESGATITHHHAVGADHRPWFADEIGDTGVRILRAIKAELDPTGILNPGTLIP